VFSIFRKDYLQSGFCFVPDYSLVFHHHIHKNMKTWIYRITS
jgi:hypothetical protein